jgi:thiol-disulfide isomerase/thioredoxin
LEFERTEINQRVTFDPVRSILFLFTFLVAGCTTSPRVDEIVLADLNNTEARIEPNQQAVSVIYFLSPECPLCINYTLTMRELEDEFASDSIKFYGVFSKEWFSPEEVKNFVLKYDLGFTTLFDDSNRLARALHATVTPEVVVLNRKGELLYSGKIDNWVNDLGKKKLEVSEHYLRDALQAWRNGTSFEPKRTEPIGCLIE